MRLKRQKSLAVLVVLVSVVFILARFHVAWALLFFAGLSWFVVIRVLE